MQIADGVRLYSARDLVNFLGCRHCTSLDIKQLGEKACIDDSDPYKALLQEKGLAHEHAYLNRLKERGREIFEVSDQENLEKRAEVTLQAMKNGAEVIYQGALLDKPWHGYSDFLLKVARPSKLGNWSYDIADTKLSSKAKASHVIQLGIYSALLDKVQGEGGKTLSIVLGTGVESLVSSNSIQHFIDLAKTRFIEFAGSENRVSEAGPCSHCEYCRWLTNCKAEWEASSHLSLVAGISRGQEQKLRSAGVKNLLALADTPSTFSCKGIGEETLARLRAQAGLQARRRQSGENSVRKLEMRSGLGFNRLPQPDSGDIFFDMEGDPLVEGKLEYLFGFHSVDDGAERFTPFWAHTKDEERKAFQDSVDFIVTRLARFPLAHVYHYGSYEEGALARLAMYHGTREAEVDDLLRQNRLVDLYKVVRESIQTSEDGLSLKNLEVFYLDGGRKDAVQTAGESILAYEKWIATGDKKILDEIRAYNELDCRSTKLCRDWLISLRPAEASWKSPGEAKTPTQQQLEQRKAAEERTEQMMRALIENAAQEDGWRQLLAHLLEFHRREAKPDYWAMFDRIEMSGADLLDDAECLAHLQADPAKGVRVDKKSKVYAFTFPPQDFKMRVGDKPIRAGSGDPAGEIVAINEAQLSVDIKLGPSRPLIVDGTSLVPEGPIGDKPLREAIYRFAQAVVDESSSYSALRDIIALRHPRVEGISAGESIPSGNIDQLVDCLCRLQSSYLIIQGPPGTGKTYTSSHAIVALLKQGARIGVASNSHKAINNLLDGIQAVAAAQNVSFRGVKKSSEEEQFTSCKMIDNTTDNDAACSAQYQLVAGTAWLFARNEMDSKIDFLFIDEAGQVSLANVIAMGTAAKNIVLVGDQMQLSQPIKGSHPGLSGTSALEYLMQGASTIPADRGVFLGVSYRMHPHVCSFISDAVYDGRLKSSDAAAHQKLIVANEASSSIRLSTGVEFVSVEHLGNSQRSEEEVHRISSVYSSLLKCKWADDKGDVKEMRPDDILVVSPYNMQVDLLRRSLPAGSRVGTVDKFQGQEAPVVLISMCTSTGDDLRRQVEFLFSINRLNVAISRARCLAMLFVSPRLLEMPCSTIKQMQLVNNFCWAKTYSERLLARAAIN